MLIHVAEFCCRRLLVRCCGVLVRQRRIAERRRAKYRCLPRGLLRRGRVPLRGGQPVTQPAWLPASPGCLAQLPQPRLDLFEPQINLTPASRRQLTLAFHTISMPPRPQRPMRRGHGHGVRWARAARPLPRWAVLDARVTGIGRPALTRRAGACSLLGPGLAPAGRDPTPTPTPGPYRRWCRTTGNTTMALRPGGLAASVQARRQGSPEIGGCGKWPAAVTRRGARGAAGGPSGGAARCS